jgi:RimJ/RimL family protein N-acetyltransferase
MPNNEKVNCSMIKIEEKNVTVREFNKDDYNSFLIQLVGNKGWTNNFQQWRVNKNQALTLFAYHLEGYKPNADIRKNRLMYGIFTKSGLLIGECGFEYNEALNGIEIFVGLIEQARGKGFSNEVISALKKISKEHNMAKINANIPVQHEIGIKMLETNGFKAENEFKIDFQGAEVTMRHYVYNN